MQASRGMLISFEGTEGCGKSTQLALLLARLEASGRPVELLREPGGTRLGEKIRHLLQHDDELENLNPEAELLLFAASRAQLVRERILPLLRAGTTVLLDRFLDSTTVYQGHARGLPLDAVAAINAFAVGGTLPDLTFLLDMDATAAHQRISASGRELDRIERQPTAFFDQVRAGYLALAETETRVHRLDATLDPETLHARIWTLVEDHSHAL